MAKSVDQFPLVHLNGEGRFRLVPESTIIEMLARLEASKIMPPPDQTEMTVGLVLERFRSNAGLTQEQLADLSGVCRKQIIEIEIGNVRNPREKTVNALASHLGAEFRSAIRTVAKAK